MDAAIRTKARGNRGAITALCLGMLSFALLVGASPASQPTQQVRTWFTQLADSDADVRDKAAENLMGMPTTELPQLRTLVEESRPLAPSQKIALRNIVMHVFITGIEYEPDPANVAFLGLSWTPNDVPAPFNASGAVIVTRRVQGFPAYRMLRDGDLITGIKEKPNAKFETQQSFGDAIKAFHPGDQITLLILRDGKQIAAPVQLRAKPDGIDGGSLEPWLNERQNQGDDYWGQTFAPLVDEPLI